jgi:hypothetical protein
MEAIEAHFKIICLNLLRKITKIRSQDSLLLTEARTGNPLKYE